MTIRLQQVAREATTAVGPRGIEARLGAGFLTLFHALIYVHAGQTVLSQPIARVTPAPLWGKGPSGSPLGDTGGSLLQLDQGSMAGEALGPGLLALTGPWGEG